LFARPPFAAYGTIAVSSNVIRPIWTTSR